MAVVEAEAEAEALREVVAMREGVHILVVVLVEGILTGLMVTMVGGLEAVVLDIEEKGAEVQLAGIGVQLEKEKIVKKGELE